MLKVGDDAPDFDLPLDDGKIFKLSGARGKHVILYFYPKDDTPGCTQEGRDFTQLAAEFEKANAIIVGVSKDDATSHQCFRRKYNLAVHLATDAEYRIANLYGALGEKKNFGKTTTGLIRSTFWINPQGQIAKMWSPVKVNGHAAHVLKAITQSL